MGRATVEEAEEDTVAAAAEARIAEEEMTLVTEDAEEAVIEDHVIEAKTAARAEIERKIASALKAMRKSLQKTTSQRKEPGNQAAMTENHHSQLFLFL